MDDSKGGFFLEELDNGWVVGRFEVLNDLGIPHLFTTRCGPDVAKIGEDPSEAIVEVKQELGLTQDAYLTQIHGGVALYTDQAGCIASADGLCTTTTGLALIGKSADCPLVLVAERQARAVGFAHASWRSTVAGIVPALIRCMQSRCGCRSADLVACIGPSIGPECFEVGPEVYESAMVGMGSFAQAFFSVGPQKQHFDLWQANTEVLLRCGLPVEQVYRAGICTVCRNDLFPSYRREGASAGRFLAALGRF